MTPEDKKWWLRQEEARLINYQHQHRGVSFIKLLLPPTTDKEVNMVGLDNHIYRGSIPRVPEDHLPPEVDAASIDEEALYREIRDMNFPPVPPQEPLGPSRRIGGPYTLAKKLTLAPVKVDCGELEETLLLGKDGGIYKGTAKYASTVELEKQLRGTKRPVCKVRQQRSSRGFVEPSVVSLQTNGKSWKETSIGRRQAPLVEVPIANVGMILDVIKGQNMKKSEVKVTAKGKQQTQEGKDADETERVTGTNDTQESKDTEETEYTDNPQATENTDDTQETKDTESEYTDNPQATENTDDTQETKDTESEYTEDSEDSKSTEAPEEAMSTEDSDDKISTEAPEAI